MKTLTNNSRPIDVLAFEYEQEHETLIKLQLNYKILYKERRRCRCKLAKALKEDIARQQGKVNGLLRALQIFSDELVPF